MTSRSLTLFGRSLHTCVNWKQAAGSALTCAKLRVIRHNESIQLPVECTSPWSAQRHRSLPLPLRLNLASPRQRYFTTSLIRNKKLPNSPVSQLTRPPRPLSDDRAQLPPGYTFYPLHSDVVDTPPKMTHIHTSSRTCPPLPRCSVFDYIFPPVMKGKQPIYYRTPNENGIAFIDGLTGRSITRKELRDSAHVLSVGLRAVGAKKGEVALLFGFNSIEYVLGIMGCQAAGIIVSPANAA
jgi:hypothetical protein